jgi:transcriptional regulator with XRE-family HTH domain
VKKTIYSKEQKAFCKMLREQRKRKLFTQVDLAEGLEVNQQWVSKVESGERRLDVLEFSRVAEVLSIDVGRFFEELRKHEERIARRDLKRPKPAKSAKGSRSAPKKP